MSLESFGLLVLLIVLLVPAAYLIGRAFSIGHFKTKLEYLRSMIKELEKK
jgi:hypothetical protein